MDFPLLSNREVYCVGYGLNRLEENGSILIIARTIDQVFIILNFINNFTYLFIS